MPISTHSQARGFQVELAYLNRILDAAIIWFSLYLLRQYFQIESDKQAIYVLPALLAIIIYFLAAELFTLYRLVRLTSLGEITKKIVVIWAVVTLVLLLIAVATKSSTDYSRLTIGSWLILCPVALITSHLMLFKLFHHLSNQRNNLHSYAILGEGQAIHTLPEKIAQAPWARFRLAGTFTNLPVLLEELKINPVDYVFLSYGSHEQQKIISAIRALEDSTASIYLVPDLLLSDLLGSRWIMLGDTPLVVINDHPFYGGWWALKKIEDLVLGSLILLLTLPLMAVIAIVIKLSSPGPVLFKQRRHGLNGEVIKIFKFRTMTSLEDGDVIVQATQQDTRITKIGKFLRRHSLDELPQFFNVLEGTMSIVGPRPHALAHNEHYRQLISGYMQRHKVKPGITGWAQAHGLRGETETVDKMQKRVEYDLYYINHWSIGLDLKIILLTIFNGFKGKTAY
jgi:putative colanic acid biosynthesis UDP-glucose lipid carrier transferase